MDRDGSESTTDSSSGSSTSTKGKTTSTSSARAASASDSSISTSTRQSKTSSTTTTSSQSSASSTSSSSTSSTSQSSTVINASVTSSPTTSSQSTTSSVSQAITSTGTTSSIASSGTATSVSASTQSSHSGLSPGATAAAVVVPLVVVAALGVFFFFWLRRRRNNNSSGYPSNDVAPASNEKSSRQNFNRGFGPAVPTLDDAEKELDRPHELSQMQRRSDSKPPVATTSVPSNAVSTPRRPIPVAPLLPPTSSHSDDKHTSFSKTSPISSTSSSPTLLNSPTIHHPSGSIPLPPTLPEVDTGHFFDTPIDSSPNNSDPFGDPTPGQTPSPIAKQPGRYLGPHAHQPPPPPRLQQPFPRPSNPQLASLAAFQYSPTSAAPPSPIRGTHYLQSRPPFNRLASNHTGQSVDKHPKSPADSDAFSIATGHEEDDAEPEAEVGVAEYATTARVAQVAQVVGGNGAKGGNRASVVHMGSPAM